MSAAAGAHRRPRRRPRPLPRRRARRARGPREDRRRGGRRRRRGAEVVARAPDVVLLDVHLPGGGGVEILRRLAEERARQRAAWRCRSPTTPRTSSRSSAPARAATSPRRSPRPSWPRPIRRVHEGDAVFSPRLAGFVLDAFAGGRRRAAAVDPELDQLTAREREVLRHIARGYLYKEIAAAPGDLGQDRRGARQRRAAQAAALHPPRAEPLGGGATPRRLSPLASRGGMAAAPSSSPASPASSPGASCRACSADDPTRASSRWSSRGWPRGRAPLRAATGVEVQPGDITDPLLGLGRRGLRARWPSDVVAVFHLAAIYDLAVGAAAGRARQRRRAPSTSSTSAARAPRLERLHYVSTAYVAGPRSGLVLESELAAGQAFKNHYESTKFAAEVIVRASMDDVPTTIYRPAIVVGDSRTGETQKFDGPYYLLRIDVAPMRGPLPQIGRGDAPFNVVPGRLRRRRDRRRRARRRGRRPHAAPRRPRAGVLRRAVRLLAREYDGRAVLPCPARPGRPLRFGAVRRCFGGRRASRSSTSTTRCASTPPRPTQILGRHGLRCPRFPEYVGRMVAFFREHERDPAFVPTAAAAVGPLIDWRFAGASVPCCAYGDLSCDRRRGLPGLPSLRRAAGPCALRRQPRDRLAGQHRQHLRGSSSPFSRSTSA